MSMMTIRLEETSGDSKNEVDEENKVVISKLSPAVYRQHWCIRTVDINVKFT